MRRFFSLLLVLTFSLLYVGLMFSDAWAQPAEDIMNQLNSGAGSAGLNVIDSTGEAAERDPRIFVAEVIMFALQFMGIIFIALTVYAGYLRITAHGEQDKIEKSTKIISSAVIGLAVVLLSLGITKFVVVGLQQAAMK